MMTKVSISYLNIIFKPVCQSLVTTSPPGPKPTFSVGSQSLSLSCPRNNQDLAVTEEGWVAQCPPKSKVFLNHNPILFHVMLLCVH